MTGTLSAAERSYPTSEVKGRSRECQAVMVQEQLRGATPHPGSGVVVERTHPGPNVRGSGAWWSNPMSKEQWLPGRRRA